MPNKNFIDRLKDKLKCAINEAYQNDKHLITRGGMEQACVFKIGYYLQESIRNNDELQNHSLDCEYNKSVDSNTKPTSSFPKGTRPDLILHKRGTHDYNLLVVEFKGWWSRKSEDNDCMKKLKNYTSEDGIYRYKLGVYVKLGKDTADFKYFINGALVSDNNDEYEE
jgi:hypothetical protein